MSVQLHTLFHGKHTHLPTTQEAPLIMCPRNHYPNHSHCSDFHHQRFALPIFELYTNVSLNMYFQCVASLIQYFICDIYPCGTGWFIWMVA